MEKRLIFSVIALIYICVFKITNFEFGDIASATLLIYIGVPFFVFLSLILFIVSFFITFIKKSLLSKL